MKIVRKITIATLVLIAISTFISCKKWLEVRPSDRVTEHHAFSSIQSFTKALNGVYIELNSNKLYGQALTAEFVDILGQYYDVNPESIANYELANHNYSGATNLGRIEGIWAGLYHLIANTNLIIKNCETNKSVLPTDYYELIKGEALALRAMLHFDLFRLFGPTYTKGATTLSIPYYDSFSLNVNETIGAASFLEHTINDLKSALILLKNDPIITYGPKGDESDSFKKFRTLRLNFYATKALLARVYLYAEERSLALEQAKDVIAVQQRWFPWVQNSDISTDRVFSSEILFSVQNIRRASVFNNFFDGRALSIERLLAPREDVVLRIFNDQRHDYRYVANLNSTVAFGATNYKVFEKYVGADSLYNQLIPMLKMSEVFYIAAECDPDPSLGLKTLNTVRNSRGIVSAANDKYYFPDDLLRSEYTREFWGEGQLFYYFKRIKANVVQSPHAQYETKSMNDKKYKLPIPEGETKFN